MLRDLQRESTALEIISAWSISCSTCGRCRQMRWVISIRSGWCLWWEQLDYLADVLFTFNERRTRAVIVRPFSSLASHSPSDYRLVTSVVWFTHRLPPPVIVYDSLLFADNLISLLRYFPILACLLEFLYLPDWLTDDRKSIPLNTNNNL